MRALAIIATVCLIAGCSSSDPTASTEYADLLAERDELASEAEAAAADAKQAVGEATKLEAQLAEINGRLAEAEDAAAQAKADLAERGDELSSANDLNSELEQLGTAYQDLATALLESWFALSPVERRCVAEGLTGDAAARDEFIQLLFAFEDVSDEIPTFTAIAEGCGLDMEDLIGTGVLEGEAYGDNPELDALYDQCAAGDGLACDDLYFASGIGTEYERFGATCGERFEDETENAGFCEGQI